MNDTIKLNIDITTSTSILCAGEVFHCSCSIVLKCSCIPRNLTFYFTQFRQVFILNGPNCSIQWQIYMEPPSISKTNLFTADYISVMHDDDSGFSGVVKISNVSDFIAPSQV